jgi:hypothetical protein
MAGIEQLEIHSKVCYLRARTITGGGDGCRGVVEVPPPFLGLSGGNT